MKKKAKAKSKAVAIVKRGHPETLLGTIMRAASDPRIDVGKMKELLAMRQEEEKRQAEIIFNNALADAIIAMPPITKDSKGDRNIRYASLVKVSNALDPLLREHGFVISFGMADSPNVEVYRITAELRHRAGYKRKYFADIPVSITGPAGKPIMTKAQGAGAAISFGRRYLKLMIFDIRIINEDTDGAAPAAEVLDMDELQVLQTMMTKAKANTKKFCEYFEIGSVPELPKAKLDEAKRILKRMIDEFEKA
jgi:ERF superfamily